MPRPMLLLCLLAAAACTNGRDDDGNNNNDNAPDAGPVEGPARLLRAHTGDGKTIRAYFDQAVALQAGDVAIEADSARVPATVSGVAAGEDHSAVITLAQPLATGKTYTLVVDRVTTLAARRAELKGTLNVALIWHQHQPSYVEPVGDYLRGPWVRKHGTKDYYDMASMLEAYPDIHVAVNLTPILLMQLEDYYLARLQPYVNTTDNTVNAAGYFAQRTDANTPVTDPWLDLLLTDTPEPASMTAEQKGWFYKDIWSNFSISDVMLGRFPAYKALRDKRDSAPASFTKDDLLQMKGWFQLAWFDPDFLRGPVTLPDGKVVNLSDLVTEGTDGKFALKAPFTEAVCKRLVVEEYKVLSNIVGIHKKLMYDAAAKTGQIEVMTTPYFHPILPLVYDGELAKEAMASSPMPAHRYQQEQDAAFHVAQAARTFKLRFGKDATGMWPGEGSVAQKVVGLFADNGVRWIATDRKVLEQSTPSGLQNTQPYRIVSDSDPQKSLAIVFRDTTLSDKLGFQYQGSEPAANVADFMASLRGMAAPWGGQDRLLSVILDGENAWEWYGKDNDAKGFLKGMYEALTKAQQADEVRTVTVSEYLSGNDARKVAAHPTSGLTAITKLRAASWINANFDTWIGEEEENLAWDYLWQVRQDLATFEGQGLARPALDAAPTKGTAAWHAYKAWYAMYAAEGSDWFWWYGGDQTAAGGDAPFDHIYTALLESVYRHAKAAGIDTEVPAIQPILRHCEPPLGAMSGAPTIDGAFSPDDGGDAAKANEWSNAGTGACRNAHPGLSAGADDVLQAYYMGYTPTDVYFAVRLAPGSATRLGTDWKLRLYFSQKHIVSLGPPVNVQQDPKLTTTREGQPIVFGAGGAARELTIVFSSGAPAATLAVVEGSAWATPSASANVQIGKGANVVELKIPKSLLNYQANDPLEMMATAVVGTTQIDRAPPANSIVVHADRSRLVEITFVLDATGSRLPLNKVKGIDNPPPPAGTGKAWIVGSLPELGNVGGAWNPNTIQMADDGATHGDLTAGDNFWSFRLLAQPNQTINYKYTIGDAGDGWGESEEYPLTNRGLEVKDIDGDSKMVVNDVFADRPEPSGAMGAMSTLSNP